MRIIEADGVCLSIVDNAHGPAVRATGDADAFGYILNNAMRGLIPDLEDRLERGVEAECGDIFVARPTPGDDLSELIAKWRKISDRDPGDDIYLIGVAGLNNLVVVPRTTLLSLIRQLKLLRLTWTPSEQASVSASTARPSTSAFAVSTNELEELERLARELDRLEAEATGNEERATVSAKRRILLSELNHAMVLDGDRATALVELEFPVLAAYADAAAQLRAYFASEQRRKYLPPIELMRIDRMPVSLDWFRFPNRVPPGFDAEEWLAYCESGLRMAAVQLVGGEGDFFTGGGGRPTATVFWRRDDVATPAIVRAKFR